MGGAAAETSSQSSSWSIGIGTGIGIGIGIAGDGVARPVGKRKLCPSNSSMIVVQRDAILVVNLFLILMLILSTAPSSAIDDHWREQQQQQPAWHKCLSFPQFLPQWKRSWIWSWSSSVSAAEVQLHKLWKDHEGSAVGIELFLAMSSPSNANAKCHHNQITETGHNEINSIAGQGHE